MKLSLLLFACAAVSMAAIPEPIKIDTGALTGASNSDSTVREFKGIPFAAPPVGDLRFKEAQPPAKWEGVKEAVAFSPTCATGAAGGGGRGGAARGGDGRGGAPKGGAPKGGDAKGGAPNPGAARGPAGPGASEDCLYANVWTPAKAAGDKLPVMVWTYGGGFTGGSGSDNWYDGEALAKKGIVVVTYNYRLGTFGFFAHPDLKAESSHHTTGNYAMTDMLAALRWVQKNIAAFGGDPKKVTIDGESAGAIAVAAMVGSPEFKGLFIRAAAQSGAWMGLNIAKQKTMADAEEQGKKAAGTHTMAELRAMSTADVSAALRGVTTGMLVDGWLIPEDQSITFAKGKQNDVDILVGSNRDEGTFFVRGNTTAEQAKMRAQQQFGDLAADFLKLWPASTDEEASASALARSRDEVGWHMRTWAELEAKKGKKAYVYYFTHVPPGGGNRGATHTAEISYMYGNPRGAVWTDEDKKLSDMMTSYWANFFTTGDPNGKGLPKWEAYNPKTNDGKAMVLGDTVAFGPQIDVSHLQFFDKVYAKEQTK